MTNAGANSDDAPRMTLLTGSTGAVRQAGKPKPKPRDDPITRKKVSDATLSQLYIYSVSDATPDQSANDDTLSQPMMIHTLSQSLSN